MRAVLVIAATTVREATRRRVLAALAALMALLLGLSGWGFSRLAAAEGGSLLIGEGRLTGSIVLNLVMFGVSLIAALGTAFLAGPTLAGETESGIALAVLARPVQRAAYVTGKWLGLAVFGGGFMVLAGLAECLVARATTGFWPPQPVAALALLATQTVLLLTLALLLATVVSPMASGVVTVGLFGSAWIAGVVGGIGASLDNPGVARVGTVSRLVLPTDGLWRGAMSELQHPAARLLFGGEDAAAFPFLGPGRLSLGYLAWVAAWITVCGALTIASMARKDL